MKSRFARKVAASALLALLSTLNLQLSTVHAQGTAFIYQGRLNDGGNPAHGIYDFRFKLFQDSFGNTQAGSTLLTNGIPLTNGLFAVTIDFGAGIFNGSNYWLEVGVRTNGGGGYTDLNPLQAVTPTPYAIFANTASNLSGTISSANLSGTYGGPVTLNNAGNNFSGAFTGDGTGVTNVNAASLGGLSAANFWKTTGDAGTTPGVNFVGTTDNQPLEVHVNSQRVLQLLPDVSTNNAPDIIGGSQSNALTAGLVGTTISGGAWNTIGPSSLFSSNSPYGDFGVYPALGASYSTIGGGFLNQIQSNATFSTVAGGAINTIQSGDIESAIGGGFHNTILSNASWSTIGGGTYHTIGSINGFIGGGWNNTIQTNGNTYSAIAGGSFNVIQGNAYYSVIGGGYGNNIGPDNAGGAGRYSVIGGGYINTVNEYCSFIGGGQQNTIQGLADHSVIGAGQNNFISGSGGPVYAVIGGGYGNLTQTNSAYPFIGGGYGNTIQSNSLYAVVPGGYANVAGGSGSFAAGTSARATNNGAFVWSDTSTTGVFNSTGSNQFLIRATGGVGIGTNSPAAALHVVGGGPTNIALRIDSGGIAVSGAGVDTGTAAFVHVANGTNMLGTYITTIYNPLCDSDPGAILIVTHQFSPPGAGGYYETHPFSVWYASPHWTIYNDDGASISNMSFNVLIIKK